MDWLEVRKNHFVNLDRVTSIVLCKDSQTATPQYWWEFVLIDGGHLNSREFPSESEARKWLNKKVINKNAQSAFIWDRD